MGCPTSVPLDANLTFSICTHDADTGALTDASAAPTYRVYKDETATAILTGTMAVLDTGNTTGFYTEQIACITENGFEVDKTYTIYIEATVDGITGGIAYGVTVTATAQNIAINAATAVWNAETIDFQELGTMGRTLGTSLVPLIQTVPGEVWDTTTAIHATALTFGLAVGKTAPTELAEVTTDVEALLSAIAPVAATVVKIDTTLALNPGTEEYQFTAAALELSPSASPPSVSEIAAGVWMSDTRTFTSAETMGLALGTTAPADLAVVKATVDTAAATVAKVETTLALEVGTEDYQFTAAALELGPAGSAPSAAVIAAEVWASNTINFKSDGTMGRVLGTTVPADFLAAQTILDKIDTTVALDPGTEDYQFTAPALELTPAGAPPTTGEIAAEVWNALTDTYKADGTMGKALGTASTGGVDTGVLVAAMMNYAVAGTFTVAEIMRIMAATTSGKPVGLGTHTIAFRDLDDTKNVVTCTLDDAGNVLTLTLNEGP